MIIFVIILSIISIILSISSFAMNANISNGLDRTQIIYYNTLKNLILVTYNQSIYNTYNLQTAVSVDRNTTIDTTSLPIIIQCQITNKNVNIIPLNASAHQRYIELLQFNSSTVIYTNQNTELSSVTTQVNSLAVTLQNTGILTNHSTLLNTTTTKWFYVLQSITLGNEFLYYLKFNSNQGYVITNNNTFNIPLEISENIIYNNSYVTSVPIIDEEANKLNNAPSGIDLFSRMFNSTVLELSSLIPVNANDILFIFNALEISL